MAPADAFTVLPVLGEVAEPVARLFGASGGGHFFGRLEWYRNLARNGLDPGDEPLIAIAGDGDRPVAGFACVRRGHSRLLAGARELTGLTNGYTYDFAPAVAGDGGRAAAETIGRRLGQWAEDQDFVDLDSLDPQAPTTAGLADGLTAAGFRVGRYAHFAVWRERLGGRDFAAYMADRPSRLQRLTRRKEAKLLHEAGGDFRIVTDPAELDEAIAAYAQVYAHSWKTPEPYPDFVPGLMRIAAALGVLRLGFCLIGGKPAAVQLWLVSAGRATVFKLAHDERFKRLSPGTLLTAHMLEAILASDRIEEIDFGRGDDPYKRSWVAERHERCGLLAINPRRWPGRAGLVRHRLLPAIKRRAWALIGRD